MGGKDRAPLAKVENKMEHIDISGYLPRYFLHFNNIVHGLVIGFYLSCSIKLKPFYC